MALFWQLTEFLRIFSVVLYVYKCSQITEEQLSADRPPPSLSRKAMLGYCFEWIMAQIWQSSDCPRWVEILLDNQVYSFCLSDRQVNFWSEVDSFKVIIL